ncbi:MAG: glycerophosphodiester phosphodiesterase [Gemmatimonadales bacterium]|nr:glycerophosphodiester phosphodiesterase [Gemmatimonadales bacterium]
MPAPPRVLAHRGASGHAHENSLAAFRTARALGSDGVELDVHTTADGRLVVTHDFAFGGLGPISERTLAELRAVPLPNGEALPELADALAACGDLEVWVELKALPPSADAALLAALAAGPAPARYAVHSFDHRIVRRVAAAAGGALPIGVLQASYPLDPVRVARETGAGALWQEAHLIDAELVDAAHGAGIEVIAWTVNDPSRAAALAALGVDALCGNWPERLGARAR